MLKCTNTSTIKEGFSSHFMNFPLPKQAHYHLDKRIEPYTKEDWVIYSWWWKSLVGSRGGGIFWNLSL